MMDTRFDLVMITDRFEESIILMKELLCMEEDDVVYLALKVRRETQSTELTTDEGLGIRRTPQPAAALIFSGHLLSKLWCSLQNIV
jgi:hypothetical protein